jgi:hypothetical protein
MVVHSLYVLNDTRAFTILTEYLHGKIPINL